MLSQLTIYCWKLSQILIVDVFRRVKFSEPAFSHLVGGEETQLQSRADLLCVLLGQRRGGSCGGAMLRGVEAAVGRGF